MIVRCDSQYFFQRGLAFERLVNASHAQSFHPFSNGLVLDHRRRCPLHNEAADGFGYRQCFNNRQPSEITATLATIATAPAIKNSFSLWFNSEPRENFWLGHKFLTAICANLPHQTLRARHQNRARNQERLDPHVVQTRDRAGGVISMQSRKHLVTGQRRFHRDVGGLVVANFTHHHDVGVLPQDRAQGRGKIQTDIIAHRDLIDSAELILDRVLHRHDVVLRIVQLLQNGVESGRFTRTGRAGDQNHPVWRIDRFPEFHQRLLIQSHCVDRAGQRSLVQNTDNDFLAVRSWQNRNAKIDFFAHYLDAKTTVLRHAPFSDVQAGQNFDARGDRELQRFRRRFRRGQIPIHAITQLQGILEWLDVNVGRLFPDRLYHYQVHNLDHGRVFAVGCEPIDVDLFACFGLNFDAVRGLLRFLDHVPQRLVYSHPAMHPTEGLGHALFRRDHRHYVQLDAALYVIDRQHIGRVHHRDKKLPVQARYRHQLVRLRHLARDQPHDFLRDPDPRQIDRRHVQATPHAEGHVLIRDKLLVCQNLQQPSAFLLLNGGRFFELIRQKEPVFNQHVSDTISESLVSHRIAQALGCSR